MVAQQPDVTGFSNQHIFFCYFSLQLSACQKKKKEKKKEDFKAFYTTCVTRWLKKKMTLKQKQKHNP